MTALESSRQRFVSSLLATAPPRKSLTLGQLLESKVLPAILAKGDPVSLHVRRLFRDIYPIPAPWVGQLVTGVLEAWQELPPGHPWRAEGRAVFPLTLEGSAGLAVGPPGAAPAPPPAPSPPTFTVSFPAFSPGEDPARRWREIMKATRRAWLSHVAAVDTGGTRSPELLSERHLEWAAAVALGHGVRFLARQHRVSPAAVSQGASLAWGVLGLGQRRQGRVHAGGRH